MLISALVLELSSILSILWHQGIRLHLSNMGYALIRVIQFVLMCQTKSSSWHSRISYEYKIVLHHIIQVPLLYVVNTNSLNLQIVSGGSSDLRSLSAKCFLIMSLLSNLLIISFTEFSFSLSSLSSLLTTS